MQVNNRKKGDVKVTIDRLQMYKIPPTNKISLEKFEDFAIERLKVLREVEMMGIRKKKDTEEYSKGIRDSLKRFLKTFYRTSNDEEKKDIKTYNNQLLKDHEKDNTSHFILRLAYCRSDELRKWFIAQEVDLFKYRFLLEVEENNKEAIEEANEEDNKKDNKKDNKEDNEKSIETFLKKNGLKYIPIPENEKNKLISLLAKAEYKMGEATVEATDFYKVYFTEALDLVRSRKVYLKKGYAYVPKESLVSIISNCFRTHLSHALALTARSLPYLEEDERLLPRLTNLSRQYLGQGYEAKKALPGGKISLDQIDSLSKTSYPLCMRQLHESLRRDHHLKHGGRMQYGLFLKGIGLTLEEALMFWRKEFTRIMEMDKFDKQYAYNIRHSFGKEGKRVDYTPYSCMKIILSNHPAQGDYHGCPFRHSDVDILRQKLVAYGVPKPGIDEILSLVKNSHYQLACARYFEVTHKVSLPHSDAINHPNKYVEQSRLVFENLASGTIKPEPLGNSSIAHVNQGAGVTVEQVTPRNSKKISYDEVMDDLNADDLKGMEELGY